MSTCVIIRYGEIGTKSKRTRKWWERVFMRNIKSTLEANNVKFSSVTNPKGRILVFTDDVGALEVLRNVFGISSLSLAVEVERDIQKIKEEALSAYRREIQPGQTFRVSTQRLDKTFPLTSQEINAEVGAKITEEDAVVNLENPDVTIGIEILYNAAYIFVGRVTAYGGVPVGVQGRVLVGLKNRRSVVAAWMMLKRGCELVVYGNKEYLSYLRPFSHGYPIEYVSRPEKAKNCLAEAFSEFEPEKRKIPSFYPLLGLDEQQIHDIESFIFVEK